MSSHSTHEHYEQLCVMASVGEISEASQAELQSHLAQCADCRAMLSDVQNIHANWFPQRPGFEKPRSARVEASSMRAVLHRVEQESSRASHAHSRSAFSWMHSRPALAIAAGILLVFALSGVAAYVTLHHRAAAPTQAQAVAPPLPQQTALASNSSAQNTTLAPPPSVSSPPAQDVQAVLSQASQQWQDEKTQLEQRLDASQQETATLRREIADLSQANSQSTFKLTDLQQQLDSSRAREAKAELDLANFKSSIANKETELTLVRADNQDLRAKLTAQTASIERERDLLSEGREVRDLIAARNLHIIDVYDTTAQGKTQRAFGRVFFTEGKSLVFYAYDLSPRRPESKYAYYAWGKRDDKQGGIRKLGMFFNDDQSQKRWVLQVTDPQTLSTIDSVFVTLERTDTPGAAPAGAQVLSAFLGSSPNHP